MTKVEVFLSQTAVSQLSLLDQKQANRVKSALGNLAVNPFQKRPGIDIKKLMTKDDPPLFRLRVGDYRAIYFVVKQEVRITEILHRSKAYRWLD